MERTSQRRLQPNESVWALSGQQPCGTRLVCRELYWTDHGAHPVRIRLNCERLLYVPLFSIWKPRIFLKPAPSDHNNDKVTTHL